MREALELLLGVKINYVLLTIECDGVMPEDVPNEIQVSGETFTFGFGIQEPKDDPSQGTRFELTWDDNESHCKEE